MKRHHGQIPVASNVQTRRTTHPTGYHTPPVPDFDHSQCGQTFIPDHFVPQMTSPSPGSHPTSPLPPPTPIIDHFPNQSPSATPPLLLPSARHCSLPSPTRSIDHERRTPPFASVKPRYCSSPRTRQSSNPTLYGITFVQSPSRLDSFIDRASHNLRQQFYSSPQSNSPAALRTSFNKSFDIHTPPSTEITATARSLRSSTKQQRNAQPFFQAKLPRDLTDFLSPKKKPRNNRQL